jgi:hypothetical protein
MSRLRLYPRNQHEELNVNWDKVIGLGVAGNFTGHLEQAGEASDFTNVKVAEAGAPKGIFPFYVPASTPGGHFLHAMPVSSDRIRLGSRDENHQIEPEVALLCDLEYDGETVVKVTPRYAMAHNDCSIRRPGAKKISEKKNWGPASKGTATQQVPIDSFASGGSLDPYRLTCFLLRDGKLHPYGVDSALTGYSYFYGRLLDWLVLRLNTQQDEGPLEDIAAWLKTAGYPPQALISVGATRYTDFGETHFLQPGDRSIVVLYDSQRHQTADIPRLVLGETEYIPGLSVLNQLVE